MRIGVFKRYWKRFKYNRARRDYLVELFNETDKQIEFYLGDKYRHWSDEIEGARQFLIDIEKKQDTNTAYAKK